MRVTFEHLHFADWTTWCPLVAFAISLGVFLAWLWWAFQLPKQSIERMAQLPLDQSKDETPVSVGHTLAPRPSHAKH